MHLRFDFGVGSMAENGYAKVGADDSYHPEKGYGFVDPSPVTAIRRTDEPLTGDFCIPFGAVFAADVPDGNYRVTMISGDDYAPTRTTVKMNGERLVLPEVHTMEGQYAREMFGVHVSGGQLRLRFGGLAPRINALEIEATHEQIRVFLAGDSTVTDGSAEGFPFAGWGQMLQRYFKHDVAVANYAIGGRSSKSFISEGRLDSILKQIKRDDYLFIQFGHNDQKPDEERRTEPENTYPEHLRRYIDAARAKGAHPVLLTSVHRRFYEADGTLKNTHGAYLDAVRKLAQEENVPLIDLAEKSKTLFEQAGPEGTKSLFLWGAPGEWMNYPNGVKDNTHFQERGGIAVAGLVAEGIRECGLQSLAMFLRG